jgi:molybdate transport system substrate-binding protein
MNRLELALCILGFACFGSQVQAEDLIVLSAAAAKNALQDASKQFSRLSGDEIVFSFGTAGQMSAKAMSGSPFDIVIVPPTALSDLTKKGAVAEGSREDLGVVRVAAAVRTGAPVPDISTAEKLKAALLNASSIGMADPASGATSGIYLMKLMETLGIRDAIHSKLRLFPDGQAATEAVKKGEVALSLGQKSEITPVGGVSLISDLPQALQLNTVYSAGLSADSAKKRPAQALFKFLVGADAKASFLANGFDAAK